MAASTGKTQGAPWPVPKFHFNVKIGSVVISFQEVSGLDAEVDVIEYRSGDSKIFTVSKMPGLKKFGNVTLKKGMFKGDIALFTWFQNISQNKIERQAVVINLLDHDGSTVLFTWTLSNAFPQKYTGTNLNAQGSEVAIEELVMAHEGLVMTAGDTASLDFKALTSDALTPIAGSTVAGG